MCGIAGIIDISGSVNADEIKSMTDSIKHRGPDAEGFLFASETDSLECSQFKYPEFSPLYMLGHRRLSIIDLEGGVQPLSNEDRTVWITFNGEIYNHMELRRELVLRGHLFKTDHSDTEMIVHAYEEWGVEGFDRFNGIFAFGLLDLKKKKIILARDHFGVKPVYHYYDRGRFIFSSEIKAILACNNVPRRINLNGLSDFLAFRYVPSPLTTFSDIFKLEAGAYLEFDLVNGRILRTGTYATHNISIDHNKSLSQWIEEYQYNFELAVKRQLISDVEIGALLSGGVDSSAVSALAVKDLGYPIRTYTIGFKDFPKGNELDEALQFANYLGTIHKNIVIDDCDFIGALDEVAWFMDEPTATSSTVSLYHLTREIRKDVKVIITGQGADEPLAGYQRYWGERLYQMGFKYLGFMQPQIEKLSRCEKIKRAFRSFSEQDTFTRFMSVYYLFNPVQMGMLIKDPLQKRNTLLLETLFQRYSADDKLGCMLYMDTRAWLSDDLLMCGDKATMINSIEARVPILDKDLVHFIESIPSKFKLSWRLQGKLVHKKACEKWLPSFVINRPKKGFPTPIDSWFRAELGGYVRDQLLDGRVTRRLFNIPFVEEMIKKHQSGKEDYQRHLFALLMLEKWAHNFDVAI